MRQRQHDLPTDMSQMDHQARVKQLPQQSPVKPGFEG